MATTRNFLTHRQAFELYKALEAHKAEWSDTPLKLATERLAQELGFTLTAGNVTAAATELGITFKPAVVSPAERLKRIHSKVLAEAKEDNAKLAAQLAAVSARADALERELRDVLTRLANVEQFAKGVVNRTDDAHKRLDVITKRVDDGYTVNAGHAERITSLEVRAGVRGGLTPRVPLSGGTTRN